MHLTKGKGILTLVIFAVVALTGCDSLNAGSNNQVEKNQKVVEDYLNLVIVGEDYAKLDELVSEGVVNELSPRFAVPHQLGTTTTGRDTLRQHLQALHDTRTISFELLDMVAEGNQVAALLLVTHSHDDGPTATFPWMGFYTLEDGKIAVMQHVHDTMLEQEQLGGS